MTVGARVRRVTEAVEDKIDNIILALQEIVRRTGGRTPQPVRLRIRK